MIKEYKSMSLVVMCKILIKNNNKKYYNTPYFKNNDIQN